MTDTIQRIDFTILNYIYENFGNPLFDKVMPLVTMLADNGFVWILISIMLLLWKKEWRSGFTLLIALLIELISVNCIVKPLVHRIRPYDINTSVTLLITPLADYSFPSGHTACSFAAAVVLYLTNKKWGICAFILATAIGFSRLYLYMHFPSDVLAGMVFGALSGVAAFYVIEWIYKMP